MEQDAEFRSSRSTLWVLIAAAVVLVVSVATGVWWVLLRDDATADPVQFEALGVATSEPFAPPAVVAEADRLAQVGSLPPPSGVGEAEVLYVRDGTEPLCDVDALVANIGGDEARTAAWASAAGVPVTEVEQFIRLWTPLSLRRDTVVINHRFSGGQAVPYRAVLQAGTVVLVDEFGVPRTKCDCGNPLGSEVEQDSISSTGDPWPGFDPAAVVRVQPSRTPLEAISVVDLPTGKVDKVPTGRPGGRPGERPGERTVSLSGVAVATPDGVVVINPDTNERTKIIDGPVERLADDGQGGLFFTYASTAEGSGDGVPTAPASPEARAIWYLPAGASEPKVLIEDLNDETRWFQLFGAGTLDGELVVAYADLLVEEGLYGDYGPAGPLRVRNVATGVDREVIEYAIDYEQYTSSVSIDDDRLVVQSGSPEATWGAFDAQLTPLPSACGLPGFGDILVDWCVNSGAVTGDGTVTTREVLDGVLGQGGALVEFDLFSGKQVGEIESTGVPGKLKVVDATDTSVLLAEFGEPRDVVTSLGIVNRSSGEFTPIGPPGPAELLRVPLVRPEATVERLPGRPSFDPLNTVLPAGVCGADSGSITIRDGAGSIGDPSEIGYLNVTVYSPAPLDVDADESPETALIVECSIAEGGFYTNVVVLRLTPDGATEIVGRPLDGEYGDGRESPNELTVVDPVRKVVRLSGERWLPDDPAAAGSATFTADWEWGPTGWRRVG